MDPRLRRRRIEVVRAAGRRRLAVLATAAAVLAAGGIGWGLTRSPLLDVDRVTVSGAARTGAPVVRDRAGVVRGEALVGVDTAAVARRVRRLPWVLRATVVKEWPATVAIRVVERAPVAATRDDAGGWAVVDRHRRVLQRSPGPPANLPELEGVGPAGAPGSALAPTADGALRVAAALPPGLVPRVAAVVAGADGAELRLRPRGRVVLGAGHDIEVKLRAVLTVLGAVDGRTVATLDVRIPSSPVLTPA